MISTPPVQGQKKAASYLVGERALRMLIGFFVHTWMARTYSPEDFGFISFTVKSVGVYFAFSLFGVDEVIIKMLVGSSDTEKRDVIKTALLMRLAIGLVGWIILIIVTGLVSGFYGPTFITVSLFGSTILLQALTIYELPFMARMSMQPIFFARNTSYLAGATTKFAAFLNGWNRSIFVGLYAVEDVLWKLLIYMKAARWGFTGGKWNTNIAKMLWGSGILAFTATFVAFFDQRLPFLHLESHQGGELLGAYSVVVSLMDMIILLPMSLAMALYPKVALAKEMDPSKYRFERQRMSDWLVRSGILFSITVYFLAPYILQILYQGKYDHALNLLRGMAFISIWSFFNVGRFKWFALEGALIDWLVLALLSLGIQTIALNYFVPLFGLVGVVISIFAGQIGSSLILTFRPRVRESWKVFLGAFIPPLGYN